MPWPKGKPRSDETKRKLSNAHLGQKRPKIGDALRGRKRAPFTEQHRQRLKGAAAAQRETRRERMLGNTFTKGTSLTEEHKRKIGIGNSKAIGTRRCSGGYWYIKTADNTRWQLEHRVMMEKMLGRPLEEKEVVHHKNGNGLDNTPGNLKLMTASEHGQHHYNPAIGPRYRAKHGLS